LRRKSTGLITAKDDTRNQDLCRRWEQDAAKGAYEALARQRQFGLLSSMTDAQWNAQQLRIDKEIDEDLKKFKQERDSEGRTADDRWRQLEDYKVAGAWPKYENKVNANAQATFNSNNDAFLGAANALIDARAVELIKWLEAPLFIDTLEDFDPTSITDGVEFDYVVGEAIFGLGATQKGADKLDAWVQDAKASNKTNLLWRAIALNQRDGIAEVDAAIQAAKQHTGTLLTEASVNAALLNLKNMQRLADTYKKAQSVYSANFKASGPSGNAAFGATIRPINSRGIDSVVITLGDRVFKALRLDKSGDWVAEKIIQHIFHCALL
jgi:hypothetical protein